MKSGWLQVLDQASADDLLIGFGHFHDSILRECKYCSGIYVDPTLHLHLGRTPFLRCLFQRQQFDPSALELVFGNVIKLQVLPDRDNSIQQASIRSEPEELTWSDDLGNLVRARTLHWRRVDDWIGLRERFTAVSETDLSYYEPEPDETDTPHFVRSPGRPL